MSIYRCSIKIISRAGGRSAVASAAYRSGEKLYKTGLTHDFTNKGGVIMSEIMLPENAPERFLDRECLWNEVQKIEKRSDAQFAREVEVAFPVEMSRTEQIECVRNYINDNFVSQGMIADWALHDKGDGNPHAHILLSVRAMDEKAKWQTKQKSVFANARDEKGRPVYDPSKPSYDPKDKEHTAQYRIPVLDENGDQKTRVREGKGTEYLWERISIPANDWNEHSKAEEWRKSWAEHCNRYLAPESRIDHRSYQRQGIDLEPTIHEGYTARQMERSGKISDRCRINRDIRERNRLREQIRQTARKITEFILKKAGDFIERLRHLIGSVDDIRETGAASVYSRRTAERDRGIREREQRTEQRKRKSAETDRHIAETDRRIKELAELKHRKETENNDRIRKLMERRRSHQNHGGTADGTGRIRETDRFPFHADTGTVLGQLRNAESDTEAFLRELRAKEHSAAEKRRDREAERADRESFRQRQTTERGKGQTESMPATQPEVRAEREGYKKPGRYRR